MNTFLSYSAVVVSWNISLNSPLEAWTVLIYRTGNPGQHWFYEYHSTGAQFRTGSCFLAVNTNSRREKREEISAISYGSDARIWARTWARYRRIRHSTDYYSLILHDFWIHQSHFILLLRTTIEGISDADEFPSLPYISISESNRKS